MKDLDFDELDRAVNSLMTNVPKADTPPGEEKVKTLNITPTLDDKAEPQFDRVEKLASQVTDSKATATSAIPPLATPTIPTRANASMQAPSRPAAAPAARRGGRFMDVVHPSSDMNTKKPETPVSRQGVTIEPRNNAPLIQEVSPVKSNPSPTPVTPKPIEDEPAKPTVSEPPTSTAPTVPEIPAAAASDWPDPLDMAPHAPVKEDEPKKEEMPEAKVDTLQDTTEDISAAPLTSPFLPDAKVEKRPLGGAPAPVADEPASPPWEGPAKEDEPKTVDDPNAQLPAEPEDVEPLLPEELGNDLMAVEADTTHDALKEEHDATKNEEAAPEEKPKAEKTKMRDNAESVPSGPTSIPQQYHEEPSTGDQKNGSIYDTDTYHQPLAHPAKKKSGWMWVLWIVLILVVGAGAGAALYFSGII